MQATVDIRQAQPEDAERIADLLRASFAEFKPLYTPEAFEATVPSAQRLRERYNEGPIWIAETDDSLLGTISAVVVGPALYLRSMAVHPAARERGVGARLLTTVEHFASKQALQRLYLSTTPFLLAAIRLYKKAGFRQTSEGPHALKGTPLLTMEKALR